MQKKVLEKKKLVCKKANRKTFSAGETGFEELDSVVFLTLMKAE